MNKLELVAGIEDAFEHWNWYQDGVKESFKNLVSAFGILPQDSFRISGCEVIVSADTPAAGQTQYDVTAGAICLEGEVLPVDAHQVVAEAGQGVFWGVDVTYSDITPAEIFGGGQKNIQAVRKGKLIASNTVPGTFMKPKAHYLQKKVMDMAHPVGHPVWFDPRLEGKALSDYFSLSNGDGVADSRYEGWILLGIYPGTEDYLSKALVIIDPSDTDLDTIGKTGGEKEHSLTIDEIPVHDHPQKRVDTTNATGNYPAGTAMGNDNPYDTASGKTGEAGGGQVHNNMQPYIVAALIARKSDAGYYV